jgi:hypothetical protein
MLSVGLGIAFRNRPAETLPVAVRGRTAGRALGGVLAQTPLLKASVMETEAATRALALGRVALVVAPRSDESVEYRLDPSNSESAIARARVDDALQRAAGRRDTLLERGGRGARARWPIHRLPDPRHRGHEHHERGHVGRRFNLVDMRIKRLLKSWSRRPCAARTSWPPTWPCGSCSWSSRCRSSWASGTSPSGCRCAAACPPCSRWAPWARSASAGSALVGSRARRMETVTGLMNVVMMPMFVLSGIFFSADRFPQVLQPLIRILPLTALNDAMRAVVLEGLHLSALARPLAVLALWTLISFGVGLKLFRWS